MFATVSEKEDPFSRCLSFFAANRRTRVRIGGLERVRGEITRVRTLAEIRVVPSRPVCRNQRAVCERSRRER